MVLPPTAWHPGVQVDQFDALRIYPEKRLNWIELYTYATLSLAEDYYGSSIVSSDEIQAVQDWIRNAPEDRRQDAVQIFYGDIQTDATNASDSGLGNGRSSAAAGTARDDRTTDPSSQPDHSRRRGLYHSESPSAPQQSEPKQKQPAASSQATPDPRQRSDEPSTAKDREMSAVAAENRRTALQAETAAISESITTISGSNSTTAQAATSTDMDPEENAVISTRPMQEPPGIPYRERRTEAEEEGTGEA